MAPVVDGEGKQATANVAKFPGKVKRIGGRLYLRFQDYRSWKRRKAKGNLKVEEGFPTASWNAMSEDEATVDGIVLEELDTGLEWPRWVPSELDAELRLHKHVPFRRLLLQCIIHR